MKTCNCHYATINGSAGLGAPSESAQSGEYRLPNQEAGLRTDAGRGETQKNWAWAQMPTFEKWANPGKHHE